MFRTFFTFIFLIDLILCKGYELNVMALAFTKVLFAGIVGAMLFGTWVTLSMGAVAGAEWFPALLPPKSSDCVSLHV